jgi:hypothetical protein
VAESIAMVTRFLHNFWNSKTGEPGMLMVATCDHFAYQLLRIQGEDWLAGSSRDSAGDRRGCCFVSCIIV